jgi:hypothetical protein
MNPPPTTYRRRPSRVGAGIRAVAALVVLGALLPGFPVILATTIGNPLPGLGDLIVGDVSDTAVLAFLASVTWVALGVAWAQFTVAVLVEVYCRLARISLPRNIVGVLPGQQRLAQGLVTAVLVLVPTLTGTAQAAAPATGSRIAATAPHNVDESAHYATTAPTRPAQSDVRTGASLQVSPGQQVIGAGQRTSDTATLHTVTADGPGTWWDLAEMYLGDGVRWREIWDLNVGRQQDDGQTVSQMRSLRVGWTVLVPAYVGVPADHADESQPASAGWGLGSGAGLLAAASLLALRHSRRRAFRHRRPGRMIATSPPDLVGMEKILLGQGGAALGEVAWLDQALRSLGQQVTAAGARLPDVLAVQISDQVLELILTAPTNLPGPEPPAPWRRDPCTGHWQLHRGDHTPDTPEQARRHREDFAPYPTLVPIGHDNNGDYWLLDLEQLGALRLAGDRDRCLDLARFIAADLAHHPWAEHLEVTLIGFGAELSDLNPERLTYATNPHIALRNLHYRLKDNRRILGEIGIVDTLQGRQQDIVADTWMPQILLIDEATAATDPRAVQDLRDLVADLRAQPGRSGIVLLVVAAQSTPVSSNGIQDPCLKVDPDGHLHFPALRPLNALGVSLNAQQLPSHQAGQLARLLDAAATVQDQPMPAARGQAPWDALSDAAGAPLPELTTPDDEPDTNPTDDGAARTPHRPTPAGAATRIRLVPTLPGTDPPAGDPSPSPDVDETDPATVDSADTSATPGLHLVGRHPRRTYPDGAYGPGAVDGSSILARPRPKVLNTSATTTDDVRALAPSIPGPARRRIEEADPGLDADIATWHDPTTPRPRLSLLGPLQVRSTGTLPQRAPRVPWHTEIVAYLGVHPRGVTPEEYGTDLWPDDREITSKTKLRQSVSLVRKWLGSDPDTGQAYLPVANEAGQNGVGLYRIHSLLSDADLFRRLRLRGIAHPDTGIGDLETALTLVTGRPFDQRRPEGYRWLADLPLDHEYTAMIVDVAHLVATHHLANHRPDLAIVAAEVSLLADGHDDLALLDLVAAHDALGQRTQARHWVQRILDNHDAVIEEDLPPRTAEILLRRRWLDH